MGEFFAPPIKRESNERNKKRRIGNSQKNKRPQV